MKSHLTRFVLFPLAIGLLPASAQEEPVSRQWTNTEGKAIEASLGNYDGHTVTLIMKKKEYNLPVDKLSKEDQDWLAQWQKEKDEKLTGLLGERKNVPISHRYGQSTDDYFKGPFGKKLREHYDSMTLSGEDAEKYPEWLMKCDEAVSWKDETMLVYCPASYKGESTPMGVYINISPMERPIGLREGYAAAMDHLNLIYASPSGASNNRSEIRRMALALDALATVRAEYTVDNSRVFVGGMSGGGAMAAWIAGYFPEFRGSIDQVRGMNMPEDFPTIDEGDVRSIQRRKQAWVCISGPKDMNYKFIKGSIPQWENQGFIVKFFDVPGMGHGNAPADTLEAALRWAEASSQPPDSH